jgi:uncharacterized repeat protein (TIGR01451 family)
MKRVLFTIFTLLLLTGLSLPMATLVGAQVPLHGATIQKVANPPSGRVGDTITATIRVGYADDFGDTITVQSIIDTVHHTSGDVMTPNLLAAPVALSTVGSFVEVTHTYVIQAGDPAILTDTAVSTGTDSGLSLPWTISFPGQVTVVNPAITIEKQVSVDGGTTWLDADAAPGPTATFPGSVQFRVIVTNTGDVALSNVAVTDNTGLTFTGVATSLAVGASSTSAATSAPSVVGQHTDIATVTGTPPSGANVTASDPANYIAAAPTPTPTPTPPPTPVPALGVSEPMTWLLVGLLMASLVVGLRWSISRRGGR